MYQRQNERFFPLPDADIGSISDSGLKNPQEEHMKESITSGPSRRTTWKIAVALVVGTLLALLAAFVLYAQEPATDSLVGDLAGHSHRQARKHADLFHHRKKERRVLHGQGGHPRPESARHPGDRPALEPARPDARHEQLWDCLRGEDGARRRRHRRAVQDRRRRPAPGAAARGGGARHAPAPGAAEALPL